MAKPEYRQLQIPPKRQGKCRNCTCFRIRLLLALLCYTNITASFRRHTMMVFHKVSSVAGWMGKENQGGWKIVLSSRCRNYIIALYTLLSWQQPLCSTAGKKNSYWVYRFLLRQEPGIFVSILQEALGIISFAENKEKKEKYISNRIIYLCSI